MDVTSRGIAFTARGEGRAIVLVHGWCLNRTLWTYQEEALSHEFRVVSVDLPGFGDSAGLAGPYGLDRHADELGAVLEELHLDHVVVVGFAFGAAVAMTLAGGDAPRLAGVVLIGVPSAAHAPYDKMPRAMRRDWPDFAARSAQAICKQPLSDASVRWLGEMFGRTPLPVALETVDVLGRFEPIPLAPGVSVPALVVHGEQDDIVPIAVSEACVAQLPDATLVPVADSGHLVVIDQPERLTELVSEFAARIKPRRPR
jgi:pimeloyl-ACP methyl ester carboxylesterase